ncbi:MAG: hypothetical protein EXS42_03990 [Lacunisphaera sp.]|nr:hypothetical protein [Lacunisphaera sp.]
MQRRQFIRNVSCLATGAMGRAALRAGESFPAAPATSLPEAFNRVQFFNVQEITPATDNEGWRLCRVPAPVWVKLNDSARKRAYSPAGCEIRFNLVGDEARILLKFVETRGEPARWLSVLAEVCHGDFSAGWAEVRDT